MNNNAPVVQFYHGKTVFITGATGFMGKVDFGLKIRNISLNASVKGLVITDPDTYLGLRTRTCTFVTLFLVYFGVGVKTTLQTEN